MRGGREGGGHATDGNVLDEQIEKVEGRKGEPHVKWRGNDRGRDGRIESTVISQVLLLTQTQCSDVLLLRDT